jgi:hypothetical protein
VILGPALDLGLFPGLSVNCPSPVGKEMAVEEHYIKREHVYVSSSPG